MDDLPWNWFDFEEKPGIVTGGRDSIPAAEDGGWRAVYRILMDGRDVPFKVLRKGRNRPALMLLHGMGLTIASFRGVCAYLFPTHDLLLPDYSSFSLMKTGQLSGDAGMKSFLRSLFRIADVLEIHKFRIGGNSLGAGLSLLAALDSPERVERLVLSNAACFPQKLPSMYRLTRIPLLGELFMTITRAERLVGGIEHIGYFDRAKFDPELKARYLRTLGEPTNRFRLMTIMRHLPAGESDYTAALHVRRLGEIRQPVFLTWGGQDPLLAPGSGERLAEALPNVVFDRHPDLCHMPHEEAPERIGPRWAAFLNAPTP